MTAREMFEEQRYKRHEENEEITYLQRFGSGYFRITFDLPKEEIAIDTNMENVIESDLLQAIIQQAKELNWIDEKIEIKEARNQEVTNLEYYKDEIIEDCVWNLAVVKGRPKPCNRINCHDCEFYGDNATECCKRAAEWLKQPCTKSTCELTQFEYDLLQSYSNIYKLKFKTMPFLDRMKEKGYFKGINEDETIEDILAKCEVVG